MWQKPMKGHEAKDEEAILRDPNYVAEKKYDGRRVSIDVGDEGDQHLWSSLGHDVIGEVPWLREALRGRRGLGIEGEMWVPGGTSSEAAKLENRDKLVIVGFHLTRLDGLDLCSMPFMEQRKRLEPLVAGFALPRVQVSELSEQPEVLWAKVKAERGEGIMMKHRCGTYQPGKRSWDWQKVKIWRTYDVVITGCDAQPTQWTVRPGHVGTDGVLYPEGKPSSTKLAGHVGLTYGWYVSGRLVTVGSVGYTGPKTELEPLVGRAVEVKGYGIYKTGAIRHVGVLRFRDDKLPQECVFTPDMANLNGGEKDEAKVG